MKKALDVEILGQKFTISSDAEEGYMLKVADYVDGKMQELMHASKPAAKTNVAMLEGTEKSDCNGSDPLDFSVFRFAKSTTARYGKS